MKQMMLAIAFVFGTACLSQMVAQAPLSSLVVEKKSEARLATEEKAFGLMQQVIDDAGTLRLWENRALVYASVGDLLWETDQRQARKLFRISADELLNAASTPVKKPSTDFFERWISRERYSPRRIVLIMIAERDANLALQMLNETRTPAIQLAIDRRNLKKPNGAQKTPKEIEQESHDQGTVLEERGLEQLIAKYAAEQDPSRAAAIIRKSIKEGISPPAIDLLKKVNEVDADLASDLVSEVVRALLDADFSGTRSWAVWSAQGFLTEADKAVTANSSEKSGFPVPDKSEMTSLAEKIADFYISKTDYNQFWSFTRFIPTLLKYAPSKSDALKAKQREVREKGPEYLNAYQKAEELIADESKTSEELVLASRDFTTWQKSQILRKAIEKAESAGTLNKLRDTLKSEAPGAKRDEALGQIDTKLSQKAIKDGELDKIRDLIETTENLKTRIKLTVDLALGFEKENTDEAHSKALGLMNEASRLVRSVPEDKDEAADMLKVAAGYAEIEPKSAFNYLEGLTVMANDLLLADSLRAKYDKRSSKFIEREVIFSQHVPNEYGEFSKSLQSLAISDFDRTLQLTDNIRREDVKILLKLLLVQAVIKGTIGFKGNRVLTADFI